MRPVMRSASPPAVADGEAAKVKEMLLVGRGGEGVVLASRILAATFARAGLWAQSFPEFKAERRGAPISAFLRWSDASPIHRRYKVKRCDVLVVVSPSLPPEEILAMLRPGGLLILNRETRLAARGPFRIARVPAARIAEERAVRSAEGRPLGNTAVTGACVRLLLPRALGFLGDAVAELTGALADANVAAARDGYARCRMQRALPGDVWLEGSRERVHASSLLRFPVSSTDSRVNHTGTWAYERPVLTGLCTACGVCALFCPEGAITRHGQSMLVDERYCKGCGICEVVCPVRNAIALRKVEVG